MERLNHYLPGHWFGGLVLAFGVVLGLLWLGRWRRFRVQSLPLGLAAAALALFGLGGLGVPFRWLPDLDLDLLYPDLIVSWAFVSLVLSLAILFGMILVLITTGAWSAYLGYGAGGVLLLAVGGLLGSRLSTGLIEAARLLGSLEAQVPWWVLLPLLAAEFALIAWWSYRSLAGLGPVRRWLAIGLRSLVIMLLTLALLETRLRHQNENITVLFLVDRSLSIPKDIDPQAAPDSVQALVDRREQRIEKFINEAVERRGPGHERDKAGLILFGRRPRLEFPPSDAPSFKFRFRDAASPIDGYYTDIAAALKLALASFPEGTGKRIVLLSDGNENLGNAEEQARIAEKNGVQIDVVPLAAGQRNDSEVLVQAVEAPAQTEQGARLPIRVLVRSYNPRPVLGTLTLKQVAQGEAVPVAGSPMRVEVHPGLNLFRFKQPLGDQQKTYTYQAIFTPEGVKGDDGEVVRGLPGDRPQNNSASTHVVAFGQRRILLLEQVQGDHQFLADRLREVGNNKYKVYPLGIDQLPHDKAELAAFLSTFDCVILANVPAETLNEEQMETLRSNTHDQGCGLVMIGGPDGFGAGGWQNTPVEKALPVDCDIKSMKITGKGGLVLIMHACEMADGNRWQKEIAKLAISKLSPMDEVGMIGFDFKHSWHIPLQLIGGKRKSLMSIVDRVSPGDMPDFDTPLNMAHRSLIEPERNLATRHCIIITDGDPQLTDQTILPKMRRDKITVTTIGIATHGVNEDQKLKDMAARTGGRFYKVTNPRFLPAIYIKETRIVSQSFVHDKRFQPRLLYKSGPTDGLPDNLPPLGGFVRTTPKESPLVESPIVAPLQQGEQPFPILAYWHYGLGKSVAFTSDARSLRSKNRAGWDFEWANSEMYSKFWEQVLDHALRPVESRRLVMTTEYRDGKVKVTVDARDENNRPLTDLQLRGAFTPPEARGDDPRRQELRFEQKNSGVYEAEFKAEEAGSYFINAQAVRRTRVIKNGKQEEVLEPFDSVRAGVTIPYSPEFSDLETNLELLNKLKDITGGQAYTEDEKHLEEVARSGAVFRRGLPRFRTLQPVWYWLVFLAATLLFFDVAVRRIALSPREVATAAERLWSRLRGRAVAADTTPQYFERLKSRKAQVEELLDKARAARRFEGETGSAAPPPGAEASTAAPAAPPPAAPAAPPPTLAPQQQPEAADYASRLLQAKRKVWEQRDKENP